MKQTKKNTGNPLVTKEGKSFQVTENGSLGLLALGYTGLMAWREKRIETAKASKKKQ